MRFIKTILLLLFSVTVAKAQVSVFGKVDHITPDGVDTVGGITLTVSGSTAPYTYTWNPGAINTKDIANKTAGHYTVNVLSASSQTYTNAYKIGYKVQWTNLYNAVFRNDSLFNTTDNSTAVSKNTLSSNTDGWFEYVFTSLPAANHLIGFSDSISPIHTTADIDYGIYYDGPGNRLYSLNTGSTSVIIKTGVKTGDVVRVERMTGNVVKFFVNNTAVKTVTISGVYSKAFKLKAYFSGTTKLNDVGCSFIGFDNNSIPNYVRLKPYIRHNSGYGSNDGLIKVTPRISFSNTYSWSPGGATTSSVTSLSPGLNKITVKDSLLNSSNHYYNVGYKVQWTNLDMCSVVGDSLLTSATSNYKATANSKNVLRSGENGWIEYVVEKITGENVFIGFTDSLAPIMGTTNDIDYGINFSPSTGYLYYIEGASTAVIYTNLAAGDLVKIERSGNTIYYKVNNVVVGSATAGTISSKTFRIKAGITNADYIARVGCSFYNNDSTNFKNYVQVYKTVKHSSGSGINDGLVFVTPKISGTTTYTWVPGSINTNSVNGVSLGNYTVSATDNMSNATPHELNVGYKAKWTNLSTCFFRNDTIKGTGPNNTYIGSAYSKNVLHANEDGWVEYVVKSYQAYATWLGFADSSANTISSATEILYGLQTPGFYKTLSAVEGSSAPLIFSYVRIGDVLRVERVGNSILYKINGVVLRTVTSSSIGPKVLKLKIRLQYNNELANVGCSFGKEYRPAITHVSCPGSTNGSVYSNVRNGSDTYTYVWQPGSGTNSYITGQGTGTYSVTISSASDGTVTLPYDIGYKTRWSNLSNTTVSNDTLKQTRSDHANSWSNGATSLNTLPASTNGWVEYVATSPLRNKVFGLLDTVISADNYTDIDFGIYLNANGSLYTSNNGTQTSLVTYVPGDLIRIQRSGDTIAYKKNGTAIYTATVSSALLQKDWKVKAAIYEYGGALENVGCSFSSFDIKEITVQDVNCVSGQNGIATFNALGGATPYSFYWDGGSLTSSTTYTNLSVGVHSVQAIDNNSCTATQNFTVTRCPNWTTVNGGLTLNSKGDVTKSSGVDSWNDNLLATADTFRLADTAFWLSFNAPDTASVYMIGFRSLEEDTTTQVTNYKLFLENSSVTLLETDNDGFYNKREIAKLTGTKDLKIQLTTQGIEYYSAPRGSSSYELLYRSRLFANRPFIIESQLYKTGSKVNRIRVSGDGN